MAYNHGREERKWRIWKEAEETVLRKCGVDEELIMEAELSELLHKTIDSLPEIQRRKACEFSCDEAVLTKMGQENAQDYGKTLLDAMAAVGKYEENLGTVTLSENKQLLKERLNAIMNFKKKSAVIRLLTGVLTLCVMFSAVFVGVYPVSSAANDAAGKTGTYIYDENFAFFSVAVRSLNADDPLLSSYAEKAYSDGEIAFFSTLTDCMDRAELELWLDRALEDENWSFQSMLFNRQGDLRG